MITDKVIYREIAGDAMLIPIGETVRKHNGIFVLTPSAACIFKGLEKGKSHEEIINEVLESFEVDRETAEKDYLDFMKKLEAFGITDD